MSADIEQERKLTEEFDEYGIDIGGNLGILEKLCLLCNTFKLDAEKIAAEWYIFSCKDIGIQNITEDHVDQFEKQHLSKQVKSHTGRKQMRNLQNSYASKSIKSMSLGDSDDETAILGGYTTTPESKESVKRLHTTPEQVINKRFALNSTTAPTPVASSFSPASFPSPTVSTPSAKYEARTNKGDVVTTYGISNKTGIAWKGSGTPLKVKAYDEDMMLKKPYKHMFQKLQYKADVLNDMITCLSQEMKDTLMLDDMESVDQQSQDEVVVSGRICCDSVGRMNSKSILIEGSRETSDGKRVPLDLSDVKNYSLFPGQIVTIQGKNVNGSCIRPSAIYKGAKLPFFSALKKNQSVHEGHFTIYIACGPFATCDEVLSYKPLDDLLDTVIRESPDVLVLLGPFVDVKQHLIEKGDIDETFEDIFSKCSDKITSTIKNLSTSAILIPSQRDVFHEFVYPQPPFEECKDNKVHMFPDPCTLLINDVCFGFTSTDVLFHLGAEEVSVATNRSDRLGRLADHLLLQQCYYPLHPTHEDVNLDYEHYERHAYMPITPDVLVVPSDLRYFAKDVDGCLCVNPGRLVKGQTGGTFSKLLVKPKKPENTNKSSVVEQSMVQIVRI